MREEHEGMGAGGEQNNTGAGSWNEEIETSEITEETMIEEMNGSGPEGPVREFPGMMAAQWILASALVAGFAIDLFLWKHERGVNLLLATIPLMALWLVPLIRSGKGIPALPAGLFGVLTIAMFAQAGGPVDQALYPLWFLTGVNFFVAARNRLLGLENSVLSPFGERLAALHPAIATGLEDRRQDTPGEGPSKLRQALPGLIVAIPVAVVLLSLMSQADKGFQVSVTDLMGRLDQVPGHIFWGCFFSSAVFVATAFLALARRRDAKDRAAAEVAPGFPLVSSAILMGTIAAILAYFLAVHLRTITLSEEQIMALTGYDFRTYIRRGFAELLVSELVIGATVLFVLHTREWKTAGRAYRLLAHLLLLLTAGISVSCLTRIYYYVTEYGLSLVRSFNLAGIALSFACLMVLAVRASRPTRFNQTMGMILQMFLVVYVVWACTMPARVISHYNAGKYLEGKAIELDYLEYLGPDAYPALAGVLAGDKELLAARDANRLEYFKAWAKNKIERIENKPWMEWSPGDAVGIAALKRLEVSLD